MIFSHPLKVCICISNLFILNLVFFLRTCLSTTYLFFFLIYFSPVSLFYLLCRGARLLGAGYTTTQEWAGRQAHNLTRAAISASQALERPGINLSFAVHGPAKEAEVGNLIPVQPTERDLTGFKCCCFLWLFCFNKVHCYLLRIYLTLLLYCLILFI